jgi:hypothetical protein
MTYREAADLLVRESGVTVRKWRTSNSGSADLKSHEWEIEAPEPRGPISFGVFCHEVGHQLLHRVGTKPRWLQEIEAEEYALAQFDRFGLAGRDRYEHHAARHLGWSFLKAARRSKRAAARILAEQPEWWARAERAHAAAMARPSLSRERRALDEDEA